jgi:hypothetical protein
VSGDSTKSGNAPKTSTPAKTGSSGKTGSSSKTSKPKPTQTQIEIWKGYTHYLLAADGLLRVTDALCRKLLSEPAAKKVSGVISAAHAALQGVNDQLIEGIKDMEDGKAPEYKFSPSPIPDWPKEGKDTTVFAGAWQTMKGVLEQMLDAATPSSAMGMALAGLINSGDDIIKSLASASG